MKASADTVAVVVPWKQEDVGGSVVNPMMEGVRTGFLFAPRLCAGRAEGDRINVLGDGMVFSCLDVASEIVTATVSEIGCMGYTCPVPWTSDVMRDRLMVQWPLSRMPYHGYRFPLLEPNVCAKS